MPDRIVIGSEENDERKIELGLQGTTVTLPVEVIDSDGNQINFDPALSGASTNGTGVLTGANTWVQVPTSAPASAYVLVVTKENEAGVIRWSFENGGTPGVANGNRMWNDDIIVNLAANQVVYFASSTDGDDVNWSTKII